MDYAIKAIKFLARISLGTLFVAMIAVVAMEELPTIRFWSLLRKADRIEFYHAPHFKDSHHAKVSEAIPCATITDRAEIRDLARKMDLWVVLMTAGELGWIKEEGQMYVRGHSYKISAGEDTSQRGNFLEFDSGKGEMWTIPMPMPITGLLNRTCNADGADNQPLPEPAAIRPHAELPKVTESVGDKPKH